MAAPGSGRSTRRSGPGSSTLPRTPIIQFQPPAGVAFFGPVISRLPSETEAGPLWDNVLGLASFPGFAELKRSLRERPQLRSFGVDADAAGLEEDWHGG